MHNDFSESQFHNEPGNITCNIMIHLCLLFSLQIVRYHHFNIHFLLITITILCFKCKKSAGIFVIYLNHLDK